MKLFKNWGMDTSTFALPLATSFCIQIHNSLRSKVSSLSGSYFVVLFPFLAKIQILQTQIGVLALRSLVRDGQSFRASKIVFIFRQCCKMFDINPLLSGVVYLLYSLKTLSYLSRPPNFFHKIRTAIDFSSKLFGF